MRSLRFTFKGEFKKTFDFFKKASSYDGKKVLQKYAQMGIDALIANTPKDTGITAASWYYTIDKTNTGHQITFYNNNAPSGVKVALLLQYGHATRNGGWVEGVDYINPALKPVFNKIAKDAWEEVTR